MKLILSRKGFDSSAGEIPSIILPDGRLYSFPIPDQKGNVKYSDIKSPIPEYSNLYELIKELYTGIRKEKFTKNQLCHLDPDLNPEAIKRNVNWKPIFGQSAAAQGHLESNLVGKGDIFLYFGWFKRIELHQGKLRYIPGSPDLHVIYGYLVNERIIDINKPNEDIEEWMKYHVHFNHKEDYKPNKIYVSENEFKLNGNNYPGAGLFKFDKRLQLTKEGSTGRSLWQLPKAFNPSNNKTPLTYHRSSNRWRLMSDHVELKSAYRGQEFVLDLNECPELISWVETIISLQHRS